MVGDTAPHLEILGQFTQVPDLDHFPSETLSDRAYESTPIPAGSPYNPFVAKHLLVAVFLPQRHIRGISWLTGIGVEVPEYL